MKIIKAEYLGMCFGVRDAIALAVNTAQREPLTILGDLVHNETVLAGLRARDIRFARKAEEVGTRTVMITAHGASERAINQARGQGLNVLQATCPLVQFAHRSLGQLVAAGFHPVIIGQREHVEVRGMTEDLAEFDVVSSAEDVAALPARSRFGIVAQTTQPMGKVVYLVRVIRERFPDAQVHFRDTVCQPTKQRQQAAIALAEKVDLVIVIGGAQSNNTRELVATCRRYCPQVQHVQTERDLQSDWFSTEQAVGITAGTSTPEETIVAVEQWLRELNLKFQNCFIEKVAV